MSQQASRPSSLLNPNALPRAPPASTPQQQQPRAPSAQQPQRQLQQQQSQPRISSAPLPPYLPVGNGRRQATYSTYPSRLRLGSTSLFQPLPPPPPSEKEKDKSGGAGAGGASGTSTPGGPGAGTPGGGSSNATVLGKRQRTVVNYAELDPLNDDDLDESGGENDVDGDFGLGRRAGRSRARGGAGAGNEADSDADATYRGRTRPTPGGTRSLRGTQQQAGAGTGDTPKPRPTGPWEGKKLLGQRPPGNLVSGREVRKGGEGVGIQFVNFTERELVEAAKKPNLMVPIRIEIQTETHKISDCFVWNLNETLITPLQFARQFCSDVDIPYDPYANTIAGMITAQLEEVEGIASIPIEKDDDELDSQDEEDESGDEDESETDEEASSLDSGEGRTDKRRDKGDAYSESEGEESDEEDWAKESGKSIEEWEAEAKRRRVNRKDEGLGRDLRVVLNLDVQIQTLHLLDRFEWDLTNPLLTPELFTHQLCSELALHSESLPIISHAIHEELLRHRKNCVEMGVVGLDGEVVGTDTGKGGGRKGGGTRTGTATPAERELGVGPSSSTDIFGSSASLQGFSVGTAVGGTSNPSGDHILGLDRKGRAIHGPKKLEGVWRDWSQAAYFGPSIEFLTQEEIERNEIEKEREIKRIRKENERARPLPSARTRRIRY